jgi:hypothetical protein
MKDFFQPQKPTKENKSFAYDIQHLETEKGTGFDFGIWNLEF